MGAGIKLSYYHPNGNPSERHFEVPISLPEGTYLSSSLKTSEVLSILEGIPSGSDAYRLMNYLASIDRSDMKIVLEPYILCLQGKLSDMDQIHPQVVKSVEAALGLDVEFLIRPANKRA